MATLLEERTSAIYLLRAGHTVKEVAREIGRTPRWVRKWRQRYARAGWAGLQDRSKRPQRLAKQTVAEIAEAIKQARSELEASAAQGTGLKYIGGQAIRTRLRAQGVQPLPSKATIERVIRAAELTRPYQGATPPEIRYPHLDVQQPQTLIQVDIVPHYLQGGARVSCFNAIDVASRYPTGQAYAQRRSQDAATFLIQVWQELGIPQYTQVDNESCFSGGFTHPRVLGRVVRLALQVGTELVFSPVRHPQSNGFVERFHQDYNQHVWEDTYLSDISDVQSKGQRFFALYRQRPHSRLHEQTPSAVHHRQPPRYLPATFQPVAQKRPLYAGKVHFMRQVLPDKIVSVLNVAWAVPAAEASQGVWVTLDLHASGATLAIYDAAPDVPERQCLATHQFPLAEPVLPYLSRSAWRLRPLLLTVLQRAVRWTVPFLRGTMS